MRRLQVWQSSALQLYLLLLTLLLLLCCWRTLPAAAVAAVAAAVLAAATGAVKRAAAAVVAAAAAVVQLVWSTQVLPGNSCWHCVLLWYQWRCCCFHDDWQLLLLYGWSPLGSYLPLHLMPPSAAAAVLQMPIQGSCRLQHRAAVLPAAAAACTPGASAAAGSAAAPCFGGAAAWLAAERVLLLLLLLVQVPLGPADC